MANLRRALILASGGRYIVMVITFLSTIVNARLLSPSDFGIAVLGTAVIGIAEAAREMGSVSYLVREKELTQEKIRTVFTVSIIVTLTITALLWGLSNIMASFYGVPNLAAYVRVVAFSYAIAPFAGPVYAMLSRDMAFGKLALLDVVSMLVNAIGSICLVLLGVGYMSLAWAWVMSSACWTIFGIIVVRDISVYRPSLAEWRSVLAFGACGSARAILNRTTESLYYLILGKLLDTRAVGLCQRALLLAQFPERVILAGISVVALPAFAEQVRLGQDLKRAYLEAVECVSAVLWPALMMLALLSGPVVSILLGPQWSEVVPLVRIFALALMANFSSTLNYPILVATGGIRRTVSIAFIQMLFSLAIISCLARYGLWAAAIGSLATIPFDIGLEILAVRSAIHFSWKEMAAALRKSMLTSLVSMAGPVAIVLQYGAGSQDLPLSAIAGAVVLCGIGWGIGLRLSRHPLFIELIRARDAVRGRLTLRTKIIARLSGRLRPGV